MASQRVADDDGWSSDAASHSRGASARGLQESFAQQRAWGMPGAQCTRSLACEMEVSTRASSPKVHRNHPAFPHAMVLTAYFVLSPATNSSCHRHRRIKACLRPVGPTCLHQLDTSNGCQDHTALPSASASFVSTPFDRSRIFRPALRSPRAPDAAASTASHPASVTIAIRPLCGGRRRGL
jgi:hypothetical protein